MDSTTCRCRSYPVWLQGFWILKIWWYLIGFFWGRDHKHLVKKKFEIFFFVQNLLNKNTFLTNRRQHIKSKYTIKIQCIIIGIQLYKNSRENHRQTYGMGQNCYIEPYVCKEKLSLWTNRIKYASYQAKIMKTNQLLYRRLYVPKTIEILDQ